jgi:CBS domain-containing protein
MRATTLTVQDLMAAEPIVISPQATVRELVHLLSEKGIGGVPVVDRTETVVGVVSATDVMRLVTDWERAQRARERADERGAAAGGADGGTEVAEEKKGETEGEGEPAGYFRGPDGPLFHLPGVIPPTIPGTLLDRTRVKDIMTAATFSVRPEATVPELARFLLRAGIHRALVFRGSELAGVVTTTDVLRAVAEEA